MTISVELPEEMETAIDSKIKEDYYASKSEVVRAALREFLKKDEGMTTEEKLVANLIEEGAIAERADLSVQEKKRLQKAT